MASSGRLQGWNQLPNEILLHILRCEAITSSRLSLVIISSI